MEFAAERRRDVEYPHNGRLTMDEITRDQAEAIARAHCARGFHRFACFHVQSCNEWLRSHGAFPRGYGAIAATLWEDQWIVYCSTGGLVLASGWIVAVRRTDGAVTYSGSAQDEG